MSRPTFGALGSVSAVAWMSFTARNVPDGTWHVAHLESSVWTPPPCFVMPGGTVAPNAVRSWHAPHTACDGRWAQRSPWAGWWHIAQFWISPGNHTLE